MTNQLSKKETLSFGFYNGHIARTQDAAGNHTEYAQLLNDDVPAKEREQYIEIITKKVDVLTDRS